MRTFPLQHITGYEVDGSQIIHDVAQCRDCSHTLTTSIYHRYPEDRVPSFSANREAMMSDLEDQGWQVRQEDIMLLEKEIEQANTFLVQSQDLRKASEQVAKHSMTCQRCYVCHLHDVSTMPILGLIRCLRYEGAGHVCIEQKTY